MLKDVIQSVSHSINREL